MNGVRLVVVLLGMTPAFAWADVDPVVIHVPETKGWTGQRMSFSVDLRAQGSFDGAAHFSLPAVPQSVIIPVGNPVVSSQKIKGDSWFVQKHEFALFSQQSGTVKVPPFEVRFSSRDGFTGPATDQQATVPGTSFEIQRPPNSDHLGFLVTTESMDISETWNPQPGPAKMGDVFKRTIKQRADQMTGIALAPPSQAAPDGVRVYAEQPVVTDNTERGDFIGQRQDTLTYVLQQPGSLTLPALTYVWWNPKTQELRSKTLPAVTFQVAAPPVSTDTELASVQHHAWIWWLVGVALLASVGLWQREKICTVLHTFFQMINPPDRVAARKLLRACRQNDTPAASRYWSDWVNMQESTFSPIPELQSAVVDLQRQLYGLPPIDEWQGHRMEMGFREQLAELKKQHHLKMSSKLPLLNP